MVSKDQGPICYWRSLTLLQEPEPSPGAQGLPGGVNVSIEVLLRGPARADPISRVVVGEDVAADACAQADIEAAHLAQVHCIAMREEDCVPGRAGDRARLTTYTEPAAPTVSATAGSTAGLPPTAWQGLLGMGPEGCLVLEP